MKLNKRTEYLLMAALGGVIVLSVALIIFQLGTGGNTFASALTEFRFKCTKCEHEWTVDRKTMQSYYGSGPRQSGGTDLVHCPKCGEKTAFMMLYCPACRKFFPPPIYAKDKSTVGSNPFICPHCGINIHEWYRKRAK